MVAKRVVKFKCSVCLVAVLACVTNVIASFSTAPGYTSTEFYTSAGTFTTIGGLELDEGKLYFGQYAEIKSLDLSDSTTQTIAVVGDNMGISVVVRNDGITYTSFGTSFNFPYPSKMGYIDNDGIYINQLDEDGIYDAAANSNGQCFIVANPGAAGSKIFKYDWITGNAVEVVDIGGYSGGLAFDSNDNLYYADQGMFGVRDAGIMKFDAAEIICGGLDVNDGEVVLGITAGFVGFDTEDNLYATTGWGATLAKYDLALQSKTEDIAYGGIGKFIVDGDSIYAVDTDWWLYASTIQHITVPPLVLVVRDIERAIARKDKARQEINRALAKEQSALINLGILLQNGELGDLTTEDVNETKVRIRQAMKREKIAKRTLNRSVFRLEQALSILNGQQDVPGKPGKGDIDEYELSIADISGDGVINSEDFAMLARSWLKTYELEEQ